MTRGFLKYHIKDRVSLAHQSFRLANSTGVMPILVFTMAKVGSLSVYSSIKSSSKIPVFHVHSLDEDEILRGLKFCAENRVYPGSRSPAFLINKEIIKKKIPYKIISLFRNPVDRNISAFFDAFELYVGISPQRYRGNLASLEKIYHEKLPHLYPIYWYEKQFFSVTGIDVYSSKIDTKKGHLTLKQNDIEVLLINSGVENGLKEALIKEFSKIDHFKLVNTNITKQSEASNLYHDFKEHIRFKETYLSNLLDSKYFNHFFSTKDRDETLAKWLK